MIREVKKSKKVLLVDGGSILLEMLFMVVILMIIFPLMQKDVKRRTDEIRNKAVVKDLTKLKSAVEEYLRRKPTFNKNLVEVSKNVLIDNGLPAGFSMTNILGQNYVVRIKVSENSDGSPIYDAIVLASGEGTDIPPLRIRDIVKNVKGYAGYVDGGMIYGPDWQFPITGWGDGFNESSIVMRTGFSKKEYQYVSRKPGFGSSTMEADLYMSMHDINSVGSLFVKGGLEFSGARFGTAGVNNESMVDNLSVTKNLHLAGDMKIYKDLNFPNGLNFQEEYSLLGEEVPLMHLEDTLEVGANVTLSENDAVNKFRSMDVKGLGGTAMKVANSLVFDGTDGVLNVQNLIANSLTINKDNLSRGMIFSSIRSSSDSKVSVTGTGVNLHDVIVRDVNSSLIAAGFRKIGGIDVTESTPLSVILRGIFYQYQDVYKLVHNSYDWSILPGWNPNLFLRCEYSSSNVCGSKWYY